MTRTAVVAKALKHFMETERLYTQQARTNSMPAGTLARIISAHRIAEDSESDTSAQRGGVPASAPAAHAPNWLHRHEPKSLLDLPAAQHATLLRTPSWKCMPSFTRTPSFTRMSGTHQQPGATSQHSDVTVVGSLRNMLTVATTSMNASMRERVTSMTESAAPGQPGTPPGPRGPPPPRTRLGQRGQAQYEPDVSAVEEEGVANEHADRTGSSFWGDLGLGDLEDLDEQEVPGRASEAVQEQLLARVVDTVAHNAAWSSDVTNGALPLCSKSACSSGSPHAGVL